MCKIELITIKSVNIRSNKMATITVTLPLDDVLETKLREAAASVPMTVEEYLLLLIIEDRVNESPLRPNLG
jgi:hypothetical protein